jgi:hypothetical protein
LVAAGLIAPGSGALLPRLDGMTVEHQVAGEDRRAISIARTLTELELAEVSNWEGSPSKYVLSTLRRWIGLHGGESIRAQFALDATLSNTPDRYSSEDINPRRLYLTVDPASAGYIVIGPTLEITQANPSPVPSNVLRPLVVGAVNRWLRAYDYRDALERVEMWHEWAEGEGGADQYEIPDVESCIPAEMKEEPLKARALRDLISQVHDDRLRGLIEAGLRLDRISQRLQRPEISDETREAFMDSNPPLPALLVSFKHNDSIVGVFEEEGQAMLEACPEPSFIVEIDPENAGSVRRAFDALAVLCETMAAASRLAALLPGNKEEG